MSYFVGGAAVDGGYAEDGGFAINGGKGWAKCVYRNHQIALKGDVALAMGEYDFTCATTGDERARSSTPSATSGATTGRCASSSTTLRCPTAGDARGRGCSRRPLVGHAM